MQALRNLRWIAYKGNSTSLVVTQVLPFSTGGSSKSVLWSAPEKHQRCCVNTSIVPKLRISTTPQLACYSSSIVDTRTKTNLLTKIIKKIGITSYNKKTRLKVVSFYLYESVADKINYAEFFDEFKLKNTFNSWFLVTELHVWMLLLRAMAEGSEAGEDGRFLRNAIVEAMWADVNTRAKKLGANNPSGTRAQVEVLSQQFAASLIAYDEGIQSDDKVLAAALWRRFFESNCPDYVMLERLVKYVRKQVFMLDGLRSEDFIVKPKVEWFRIKDIK